MSNKSVELVAPKCITVKTPFGLIDCELIGKKVVYAVSDDVRSSATMGKVLEHFKPTQGLTVAWFNSEWVKLYRNDGKLLTMAPIHAVHGDYFPDCAPALHKRTSATE